MALGEMGIIFHDFFLSKDTFLPLYEEYYQEKKIEINASVNELLILLEQYNVKNVSPAMAKKFQFLWKKFQGQVLANKKPLQLLVSYRGDGTGEQAQFSQILNQEKVEETVNTKYGYTYGINTGNQLIKDSMQIIQAQNIENFLRVHLSGLLNQLYSKIDSYTAQALHKYHNQLINKNYTNRVKKRLHITNSPWYKIIYGEMPFVAWQGNAYEAFLNHMANHEPSLFSYLSSHGKNAAKIFNYNIQKKDVFSEEGGHSPDLGHFPQLMMGQINSIPWFAGGDIIIINEKLEVIYNIQLKTTGKKNPTVFKENIIRLKNFLIQFNSLTSVKDKAELLFKEFQNSIANSSIAENLSKKTEDEIMNLIKKQLQLK